MGCVFKGEYVWGMASSFIAGGKDDCIDPSSIDHFLVNFLAFLQIRLGARAVLDFVFELLSDEQYLFDVL